MALLNFHYGLVKDLPTDVTNGNLYITTDSQGLYVDLDNARVHVSDFIQVANTEALNALGSYSTQVFYYVEGSNALLKYTGVEGAEWKQLNSTSDISTALSSLTARVETNETDIANLKSADTALSDRIDGLNAGNIDTTSEITITTAVGNYKIGDTIDAETSLQDLILKMLCKDVEPTVTDPTYTVTLTNSGAKEVGSKITPAFSSTFTVGSYIANGREQATGVTATAYSVKDTNNNEVKASSGSFPEITVVETDSEAGTTATNYKVTGTVTHTAGETPLSFLNKEHADLKIAAGTLSSTSSAITGFRSYFWGYKKASGLLDVAALTSADIRALGNPNSSGANQNKASTSIPGTITTSQMQQMFFAFPATVKKTSVSVANNTNGAPQTVYGPITVAVEGANGYKAVNYDVFYINNAAAESGSTTFKITIA